MMDDFKAFDNIKTPPEWKASLASALEASAESHKRAQRSWYQYPVAMGALIILMLFMTGTVLAYAFTGGEFFKQLFTDRAEHMGGDCAYMDLSQLTAISGHSIGTVLETRELKFELIDSVSSGNMAMVMLRITAKKLDSVLLYTGWDEVPLNNYRFAYETEGSLFKDMNHVSVEYIYSDEDASLSDNQFCIMYTLNNTKSLQAGVYTIGLGCFGYYSSDAGKMVPLYKDTYEISLELSNGGEYSRTVLLDKIVSAEGFDFILEEAVITPMTVTLYFSGNSDAENGQSEAFGHITDSGISLRLKDGTVLTEADFTRKGFSGIYPGNVWCAELDLSFALPISAGNLKEISFGGMTFDLSFAHDR